MEQSRFWLTVQCILGAGAIFHLFWMVIAVHYFGVTVDPNGVAAFAIGTPLGLWAAYREYWSKKKRT